MREEQRSLFDYSPRFSGAYYEPQRDEARLTKQKKHIHTVLQSGRWLTVQEIHDAILQRFNKDYPLISISAQVRNLRKKPHFFNIPIREREGTNRLYEYRLKTS